MTSPKSFYECLRLASNSSDLFHLSHGTVHAKEIKNKKNKLVSRIMEFNYLSTIMKIQEKSKPWKWCLVKLWNTRFFCFSRHLSLFLFRNLDFIWNMTKNTWTLLENNKTMDWAWAYFENSGFAKHFVFKIQPILIICIQTYNNFLVWPIKKPNLNYIRN